MKKKHLVRISLGIFLFLFVLILPFMSPVQQYLSIPNEIITTNHQSPLQIPLVSESVSLHAEESEQAIDSENFYPKSNESTNILYEFAGIPIKKVHVSVLEDIKVIPGGQSIGVRLHTLGVLVVGHHRVTSENETFSPGDDAHVKVGDIILEINDQPIEKMKEVKPIVEAAGKNNTPLHLTIKRGNETIETKLQPIFNEREKEYQIGLYIRDSAAGIGTMSFYHPESKKYGALGHVISDADTRKPIEIHKGTIVSSSVTAIEKGNKGTPGEKRAKFSTKRNQIGTITKNSPFGVFGELYAPVKNNKYDEPMSIALSHEVEKGPAKILTVIDGEKVEEFDVEIVSSAPQKFPATKGMVLQITDEKLLEATGGIVQGMSGSPIIQNGKIIGAVTHVFVNDPTSGYGVHIEWMLQEAGISVFEEQDLAS